MKEITTAGINFVSAPAMKTKTDGSGKVVRDTWNSRPVFFIHFKDGSKLVVKAEESNDRGLKVAGRSVEWGGKMMGSVSPQVQVESLTASELTVMKSLNKLHYGNMGQVGEVTQEYLELYLTNPQATWVKMEFVAALRDMEGMFENQKAMKLLDKLKNSSEPLFQLGRIAAIDRFVGNNDRFDPNGRIVNRGNIIFSKNEDKTYTPVGLDFYEAQGVASNLYAAPPADWDGLILSNPQRLQQFAGTVISSFNERIAKALDQVDTGQLIASHRVQDFLDGMKDGIATLKAYLLQQSQSGKALPSGVTERMRRLGWLEEWKPQRPPPPSRPAPQPPTTATPWQRAQPQVPRPQVWQRAQPKK
jgi:hypothetical protein